MAGNFFDGRDSPEPFHERAVRISIGTVSVDRKRNFNG